jgi:hypothetical protein
MRRQNIYDRPCKCGCGERIETSKNNKLYADGHQIKNNNLVQNEKRHKLNVLNKPLMKTYQIYDKLLGIKSLKSFSKEFLRGKGANLAFNTKTVLIEGKNINCIFDILLISENDYFTLKRIKK